MFNEHRVTWREKPVSGDDMAGLRVLKDRVLAEIAIAAGEFAYTPHSSQRMPGVGAVDNLQVDATRCGDGARFRGGSSHAQTARVRFSADTACGLHATPGGALLDLANVVYFHHHALLDDSSPCTGRPDSENAALDPDPNRADCALLVNALDADRYVTHTWTCS